MLISTPNHKISLAVLPFKNRSNDTEMDYFSDGITEEIITALTKIEQLKVISRTSSFFFKNHNASIKEIGKQLNVAIILEGSLKISGTQIRISTQLIAVEDDTCILSANWDRQLANLFEIQDEISLLIADKIRENLGHFDISDHLVENQTNNLNAYKHYLKGRYHFNKWNPEDTNLAIKEFETAISIDHKIMDAYLGLADAYSFMAVAGFAPRESAWAKAVEAMDVAKKLDEDNAGLNYMLANEAFFTNADFDQSRAFILKALVNAPTHAKSHRFISFIYILNGELKKAKKHLFYAKSIDPLNPETLFYEAFYYYRIDKNVEAAKILDELLATNEMNLPALIISLYLKLKEKKWEAAYKQIEASPKAIFTPDERLGLICLVEITKGNKQPSELSELIENARESTAHHAHSYLFICYTMLGEFDKAYEILQNLFEHKSSILLISFSNPLSKNIEQTPEYKEYHKRLYPPFNTATSSTISKSKKEKLKEKENTISQNEVEKLKNYISAEKPFLNPNLSLRDLANQVNIHPNQLSKLINQAIGKNFNEFINQKRIEHFKKIVLNPSNAHISIIGLAYESGFNSKSVFNTAFKKEVGMTPKMYQKSSTK